MYNRKRTKQNQLLKISNILNLNKRDITNTPKLKTVGDITLIKIKTSPKKIKSIYKNRRPTPKVSKTFVLLHHFI